MTNIKLKNFIIGDIDGKKESSLNNFDQLFFTNNHKYNSIFSNDNYIISGRKGTGKTILANYINNISSQRNFKSQIYDKTNFNLQKLVDMEYEELQEEEMYIFWKWLLLLNLGKLIIKEANFKKNIPWTKIHKLKKLINEIQDNDIYKIVELTKSNSRKSNLTAIMKKIHQIQSSVEDTRGTSKKYNKKRYYELIDYLEVNIFNAIGDFKFNLIYDDLDEIENPFENEKNYYKLFKSMLEASQDLNLKLKSKSNSTKFIILIRSDILDELHKHSSNSNKFTSSEVNLYWIDKDGYKAHNHPLMAMILHKIRHSVPEYLHLNNQTLYYKIFPNKMSKKEVTDYLIDHGFGRPRDFVHFLNLIINKFPDRTTITPKQINSCLKEYSRWFYRELCNEISIHPQKDSLFECIQLIKNLHKHHFKFDELNNFYNSHTSDYTNIKNLKENLNFLYKYGLIGNSYKYTDPEDNKEKIHFSWGYRNDSNEYLDFSTDFVLHYGFKKHFS